MLCPEEQHFDRRAQPTTAPAVKVLRYLQTHTWDTVKVLHLQRKLHSELETVMHYYLRHILERNLKSVDFLNRLRGEGAKFAPDVGTLSRGDGGTQ